MCTKYGHCQLPDRDGEQLYTNDQSMLCVCLKLITSSGHKSSYLLIISSLRQMHDYAQAAGDRTHALSLLSLTLHLCTHQVINRKLTLGSSAGFPSSISTFRSLLTTSSGALTQEFFITLWSVWWCMTTGLTMIWGNVDWQKWLPPCSGSPIVSSSSWKVISLHNQWTPSGKFSVKYWCSLTWLIPCILSSPNFPT